MNANAPPGSTSITAASVEQSLRMLRELRARVQTSTKTSDAPVAAANPPPMPADLPPASGPPRLPAGAAVRPSPVATTPGQAPAMSPTPARPMPTVQAAVQAVATARPAAGPGMVRPAGVPAAAVAPAPPAAPAPAAAAAVAPAVAAALPAPRLRPMAPIAPSPVVPAPSPASPPAVAAAAAPTPAVVSTTTTTSSAVVRSSSVPSRPLVATADVPSRSLRSVDPGGFQSGADVTRPQVPAPGPDGLPMVVTFRARLQAVNWDRRPAELAALVPEARLDPPTLRQRLQAVNWDRARRAPVASRSQPAAAAPQAPGAEPPGHSVGGFFSTVDW